MVSWRRAQAGLFDKEKGLAFRELSGLADQLFSSECKLKEFNTDFYAAVLYANVTHDCKYEVVESKNMLLNVRMGGAFEDEAGVDSDVVTENCYVHASDYDEGRSSHESAPCANDKDERMLYLPVMMKAMTILVTSAA